MNLQNVKQKLDKVNSFYAYLMENQAIVSRVDRDAFLASIRTLYDTCFEEEVIVPVAPVPPVTPEPEPTPVEPSKKRPKLVFNTPTATKSTPPKQEQPTPKQEVAPIKETTPIVETPPKEEEEPLPPVATITPTPEVVSKPAPVEPTPVVQEPAEGLNEDGFQEAYESLFRYKAATDLSQKLSASKLDDLQKALGLNEKFLYINELFGGDVGQFQQAIKTLNEGVNFDAARQYIEQNLIAQNDWMNKAKRPVAKDFVKLVRRRYV
ncbi:MAG: hypothetical protein ACRBFS_20820 [Aureispira sp.]